ncbi:hypothetical protein SAMN05660841_03074 [Sphingobacterium nematocida]|uniref:Uncharacterized protein n=1 Tax=Sphingobacterium nematocida TaxID=1513896 RepID=A0A1T5F6E6_9SPHI|nr:hypothetical protein [Sphingobacterium nematocida]SKB91701.1 hypothetical protein SAMN05660841_03074 [Sphingobacterium nematocida]
MKYYKRNHNGFELKENKIFSAILLFLFLVMSGYLFYTGEKSSNIPIWVFCLPPVGIFFFRTARKVQFKEKEKVLEISMLGISIQKYALANFKQILIVRHKAYYFLNNGKEVKCVFAELDGKKEISLIRKNSFKDLEVFVNETNELIEGLLKGNLK